VTSDARSAAPDPTTAADRRAASSAVPVIHAVTTDEIVAAPDFADRARGVMRVLGARGAVHLRAPSLGGRALHALAASLAGDARASRCALVINDRLDVALAADADGVQLTSRSLTTGDARLALRGTRSRRTLRVGASVHAADEARAAAAAGADWLVAGHVFATASHAGAPARGLAFLRQIAAEVPCPVIGIGGVLPRHVPLLLAAGAHGAAAIRGIWDAVDAERAAADYISSYDASRNDGDGGGGDGSAAGH
jgi:thiamine-phosphate diphosphorylase